MCGLDQGEQPRRSRPSDTRKIRKPLMERKRRARINHSLNELKKLIMNSENEKLKATKLEKADILEMTVKHLQKLHGKHSQLNRSSAPEESTEIYEKNPVLRSERTVTPVLHVLHITGTNHTHFSQSTHNTQKVRQNSLTGCEDFGRRDITSETCVETKDRFYIGFWECVKEVNKAINNVQPSLKNRLSEHLQRHLQNLQKKSNSQKLQKEMWRPW